MFHRPLRDEMHDLCTKLKSIYISGCNCRVCTYHTYMRVSIIFKKKKLLTAHSVRRSEDLVTHMLLLLAFRFPWPMIEQIFCICIQSTFVE